MSAHFEAFLWHSNLVDSENIVDVHNTMKARSRSPLLSIFGMRCPAIHSARKSASCKVLPNLRNPNADFDYESTSLSSSIVKITFGRNIDATSSRNTSQNARKTR